MKKETQTSSEDVRHNLDPVLVQCELLSFQVVLDLPISGERLERWFEGGAIRREIFSNTVWGSIRWRKSLGRPLMSPLASAFVIEHASWQSVLKYTVDGFAYVDLLAPHPEPSKWDGPHDDDYFRVSFMAETPQRQTRIRVTFAPHVGWELPSDPIRQGYLDINLPERQFPKSEEMYVLDPFDIVRKPYLMHKVGGAP